MSSAEAAPPPPPMSVGGAWQALRWPKPADLIFAAKGTLAILLSLMIGFSQNLENPYWSALTIVVLVAQPQPGAIRTKAMFRLIGTVVGGGIAILLAALFGSHIGVLMIATIALILLSTYIKLLDRTPASYTWFATAITLAAIGLLHGTQPPGIFFYGVARMAEISLGILVVGIVDSILMPRSAVPAFLQGMAGWRDRAGDFAASALARGAWTADAAAKRREDIRALTSTISTLDAQGVQLPYDTAATPPRARDIRLLRMTTVHLIASLSTAKLWVEAAHDVPEDPTTESTLVRVREWLGERPPLKDRQILDHVARGESFRAEISEAQRAGVADVDRAAVLRQAMLARIDELLLHWCRLETILHALATGRRMPRPLDALARRVRAFRSVDYLVAALDVLPLALSLTFTLVVWYLTSWTASLNAMLLAFITCGVVVGMPGGLQSARSMLLWIPVASAITFLDLFVILPRVTAFPVLAAVLAIETLPLLLMMSMMMPPMLIASLLFSNLSLQNAYTANFQSTLQGLLGSLAGALIAVAAIFLCQYDANRLRGRRLARAMDRDVVDAARARRPPDAERLLSLSADRLGAYSTIAAALPAGDPLKDRNMIARLRVAANILVIRQEERELGDRAAASLDDLREAIAAHYAAGPAEDGTALLGRIERAYDTVAEEPPGGPRSRTLIGLVGLRLALAQRPPPAVRPARAGAA